MSETLVISSAAILISIASFAFSLYQFRKGQNIIQSSKSCELLKQGFALRKATQELRDKISVTDDIDDYEELLEPIADFTENALPKILNEENISIKTIQKVEKELLVLVLEFDLLVKQINIIINFNGELTEAGYEPLTSRSMNP